MKRKIIQLAGKTLVVSLPCAWAEKYHVQKGDEIDLVERGESITLNSKLSTNELKRIDVDVKDLDRTSILIAVRGAYRAGYDEIYLKFDKQHVTHHRTGEQIKILSIIHATANLLIGAEIVSQDESGCLIKDFSANIKTEFEPTFRRIFLLLLESTSDFTKGIEKKDAFLISSMEEKHNTISKFISYCIRMINKGVYSEQHSAFASYHILPSIDNIMEMYRSSARDFITFENPKFSRASLHLILEINECLRLFYELFYKFENRKCSDFILKKGLIETKIMELHKSFSKGELMIMHNLSHILDLLWDMVLTLKSEA